MLLSHRNVVPADPSSADTAETRRMLEFLEKFKEAGMFHATLAGVCTVTDGPVDSINAVQGFLGKNLYAVAAVECCVSGQFYKGFPAVSYIRGEPPTSGVLPEVDAAPHARKLKCRRRNAQRLRRIRSCDNRASTQKHYLRYLAFHLRPQSVKNYSPGYIEQSRYRCLAGHVIWKMWGVPW